jgi:23S rRNA pseudouridine1911/1915/1917 synthase
VLFGKTQSARAELSRQLRAFELRKTYLAWVVGTALPAGVIARHPFQEVAHGPLRVHVAAAAGKPTVTRVRVLRRRPAEHCSLVAAQPITGRPDQIRVHLAALGAPILGDPLFGPGGGIISDLPPGQGGYLLHASSLGFVHPGRGQWLKVRALPPWVDRPPPRD